MKNALGKVVGTVGLMGMSMWALGDEREAVVPKPTPPQEPIGFITGAVVGGLALGPVGAVAGAGIGTWLGNRVHRAGEATREATRAEAQVASLTSRLDQLSHSVETAQRARDVAAREDASKVLDGLQGDVLFRTGSADIPPDMAHGIQALAEAVAKSPALKVRVDGYADARGGVAVNLALSEARANAVRDLLLAAGVDDASLEINAYGKSQSAAEDVDGYALERRVRLTLQAKAPAVAQTQGLAAVKTE
jgi:outer membrane protein OmpA-like peptidoglycan-associated protein